jgi:CDP-diacylglycerol--serine O-phosphatidyltransferase
MGKRRSNTHSKNPPGQKQRILKRRIAAFREAQSGRSRRQIPRAAVPSFFTLMNLFSGFMALTQILEGRFEQACWLIVLAGFFDVLDGMMARLTDGESLFGIELDSLSDIVSFGVAPAYLVYAFGLKEFGMLGVAVSSLPAICGAVRLARFNVQFEGIKKDYFVGLPIPVQAACIVSLILNRSLSGRARADRRPSADRPVDFPGSISRPRSWAGRAQCLSGCHGRSRSQQWCCRYGRRNRSVPR